MPNGRNAIFHVKPTKKGTAVKKKISQFGDFRFDYIKFCKHDLKDESQVEFCPLCRLVNVSVQKHFKDEEILKEKARQLSIFNRILLRYNLLESWARNQCHYIEDILIGQAIEISFCKPLIETLLSMSTENASRTKLNYFELTKILEKRKRIQEIGQYAVIFLQSRIRKLFSYKHIKRVLLKRFEYIPANKFRSDFFLDSETHRKWHRYPRIIRSERPITPNTLKRRLNFQEKNRNESFQRYKRLPPSAMTSWEDESINIMRLRQLALFKDVLTIAMKTVNDQHQKNILKRQETRKSSTQNLRNVDSNSNNPSKPLSGRSGEAIKEGRTIAVPAAPVWISLSAPGPSSRQFGMSLALKTPPLETMHMGLLSSRDGRSAEESSSTTQATAIDIAVDSYNKRCRELEARAFDCLRCETADEILNKMFAEEVQPSFTSVIHIALDESGIWNSSRTFQPPVVVAANAKSTSSSKGAKSELKEPKETRAGDMSKYEKLQGDILPLSLRLRPLRSNISSKGIFRIFFFEGELVAATQASPWAFYTEVNRNRDTLVNLIKTFAFLPHIRSFVRSYVQRSNGDAASIGSLAMANSKLAMFSAELAKMPTNLAAKKIENPNGMCTSLCVPTDDEVYRFDSSDSFEPVKLANEDVLRLHNEYKFLGKVSSWKDQLRKAQAAVMKQKGKSETADPAKIAPEEVDDLSSLYVGKDIYNFCLGNHVEGKDGSAESYSTKLRRIGMKTEFSIIDRIDSKAYVDGDLTSTNGRFDLLVIDVNINLPEPSESAAKKSDTLPKEKLIVDIHEVVGIFSCSRERPPANLDLGLLEWEYFQASRAKVDNHSHLHLSDAEIQALPNAGVWSRANENTGLSKHKSVTVSSCLFVLSILGAPPSREYLEETIPKKTKAWLGLP